MIATAKRRGKAEYDRKKQRAAVREATLSALGREIGEIPRVANPSRKRRCKFDLRRFCELYDKGTTPEPKLYLEFSDDHLAALDVLQRCILEGGLFAFAMPRGSGKSTLSEYALAWALLYGHCKLAVLIAANASKAEERMGNLQAILLRNDLIAADFPETIQAVRHLEGDNRRSGGQLYRGKRTGINWSSDRIVFADVPKSPARRSVVLIAGIDSSSIRGTNIEGRRPDLVLIDDPQTDESAASPKQCADRESVIEGAILGMAGPGRRIAAVMPCTVIQKGDLADRFLDQRLKPRWRGQRTKLLKEFPSDLKLWDAYKAIRDKSFQELGDASLATTYYEENRAAMDAGAVVSWPQRFDPGQISGLQYAMDLYLGSEAVFWAEYQNEPLVEQIAAMPIMDTIDIARKMNQFERKRGQPSCSNETELIVAHVDVQMDLLYWTVAAFGDGFSGGFVDYGAWPDPKRHHFVYSTVRQGLSYQDPALGFEGSLHRALNGDGTPDHPGLLNVLSQREYEREDGTILRLKRGLIDIGNWDVEILNALRQNAHRNVWTAAKGHPGWSQTRSMMQWPLKPGEKRGRYWIRGKAKAGRYQIERVLFGTNFWKSQLHDRLRAPLGSDGCLSLFKQGSPHMMFAEHLTAERPEPKVLSDETRLIVWNLLPARDNHFLDTAVGCLVAASMEGIELRGLGHEEAFGQKPKRERIKLSELQRQKRLQRGGR